MSAKLAITGAGTVLVLGLVAAPAVGEPDLRVRHEPAKLHMRPKQIAQGGTTATATAAPAPGSAPAASAATSFSPLPRNRRDLADRVIVRVRAGYELDSAGTSGETLRGGAALPDGFASNRSWIVGDAVLGARDVLLPSMGAYLLSSFQLDASDSLATRSALVVPGDANDQRIAIKAGYAEWGRDDKRPEQRLWIRAGRQFRLDGGALFAYFDGATIGYRANAWDVSAFAGQRVALYVDTERGVTFGATAAADLKKLRDWPIKVAVDYQGLSIDTGTETALRGLVAVSGTSEPSKRTKIDVRARLVQDDGLAVGRIGGRVKYAASERLLVIGDLEQRFGGDLAYDLAAPSAVDVVDVARRLGVGLAAPIDALTLGARVDYRRNDTELLGFARAEVPEGTATTVDQQGWFEGGAAVMAQPVRGVWTTAQYTLRQYLLDDAANQMGSAFGDTAGSGLDRLHELAVDGTLRSQGRSARRWRLGGGAFYRIYDLRTPYATATHEGRAGARADFQWWLQRDLHLDLGAEVAQSSPVLARELGALASVRAAMEARW